MATYRVFAYKEDSITCTGVFANLNEAVEKGRWHSFSRKPDHGFIIISSYESEKVYSFCWQERIKKEDFRKAHDLAMAYVNEFHPVTKDGLERLTRFHMMDFE